MFEIHLGIPEMEELWNRLENRHQNGSATKAEEKLRRQMGKAMVSMAPSPPLTSKEMLMYPVLAEMSAAIMARVMVSIALA